MEKVAFILGISIALVVGPQHTAEAFMVDSTSNPGIVLSLPNNVGF
jgi:hypothetical protein